MELAINPSKIISSLCYSIFRLEPYTNCSYNCSYCYARWYRSGKIAPRYKALGMFEKVAKKLEIRIPFRLATLSEPLQDVEERFKLSLKMMKTALKFEVPIILCTKSDRIAKDPWKSVVEELADDGLIVVQISVSSLKRTDFEPKAPPPLKRLETLKEVEAPKVLRLQPLIPNYSFENAEDFVRSVKDYVDQITVEPLRIERSELRVYGKFWDRWSDYSFEGDIIKVDAPEVLRDLKEACEKYGLDFGLCKEGLFELETSNCCGLDKIDVELRPTLREIYREVDSVRLEDIKDVFGKYLFGEKISGLPRQVRKALKYHEKTLLKVLRNKEVLERLTPHLKLENDIITVIK